MGLGSVVCPSNGWRGVATSVQVLTSISLVHPGTIRAGGARPSRTPPLAAPTVVAEGPRDTPPLAVSAPAPAPAPAPAASPPPPPPPPPRFLFSRISVTLGLRGAGATCCGSTLSPNGRLLPVAPPPAINRAVCLQKRWHPLPNLTHFKKDHVRRRDYAVLRVRATSPNISLSVRSCHSRECGAL